MADAYPPGAKIEGSTNLDVPVTNSNRVQFINTFIDSRLNSFLEKPVMTLRIGMKKVFNPDLINFFNEDEFELLISGNRDSIDVRDLQKHCKYTGGYKASQKYIRNFWNELEKFSDSEKKDFLKFVTCHERPPLLGF